MVLESLGIVGMAVWVQPKRNSTTTERYLAFRCISFKPSLPKQVVGTKYNFVCRYLRLYTSITSAMNPHRSLESGVRVGVTHSTRHHVLVAPTWSIRLPYQCAVLTSDQFPLRSLMQKAQVIALLWFVSVDARSDTCASAFELSTRTWSSSRTRGCQVPYKPQAVEKIVTKLTVWSGTTSIAMYVPFTSARRCRGPNMIHIEGHIGGLYVAGACTHRVNS